MLEGLRETERIYVREEGLRLRGRLRVGGEEGREREKRKGENGEIEGKDPHQVR